MRNRKELLRTNPHQRVRQGFGTGTRRDTKFIRMINAKRQETKKRYEVEIKNIDE